MKYVCIVNVWDEEEPRCVVGRFTNSLEEARRFKDEETDIPSVTVDIYEIKPVC